MDAPIEQQVLPFDMTNNEPIQTAMQQSGDFWKDLIDLIGSYYGYGAVVAVLLIVGALFSKRVRQFIGSKFNLMIKK